MQLEIFIYSDVALGGGGVENEALEYAKEGHHPIPRRVPVKPIGVISRI